jgi:hypothetical protein
MIGRRRRPARTLLVARDMRDARSALGTLQGQYWKQPAHHPRGQNRWTRTSCKHSELQFGRMAPSKSRVQASNQTSPICQMQPQTTDRPHYLKTQVCPSQASNCHSKEKHLGLKASHQTKICRGCETFTICSGEEGGQRPPSLSKARTVCCRGVGSTIKDNADIESVLGDCKIQIMQQVVDE